MKIKKLSTFRLSTHNHYPPSMVLHKMFNVGYFLPLIKSQGGIEESQVGTETKQKEPRQSHRNDTKYSLFNIQDNHNGRCT